MKNNKLAAFVLGALVVMGFAAIAVSSTMPEAQEALAYAATMALI